MTTLAQPQACPRCRGRFTRARYYEGDEWTCFECGYVDYGEGFKPFDAATVDRHTLPPDKRRLTELSETVLQLVRRAGATGIKTREIADAVGMPMDNAGNVLGSLFTRGLFTRTAFEVRGQIVTWFGSEVAV